MVEVMYGVDTTAKLIHLADELDLFGSPLALVSHIKSAHSFLPVEVFTDQLKSHSNIPMTVKPTPLWLENPKEYKLFTYNLYKDLIKMGNESIFGEVDEEERIRNHAFLVYCFGAICLQLDNHMSNNYQYPTLENGRKFKALEEYLTNFILMISKDEMEVCGNGESLTEVDRIEFAKYQLIRLLIGQLIQE